jgi:hypothetical protein
MEETEKDGEEEMGDRKRWSDSCQRERDDGVTLSQL